MCHIRLSSPIRTLDVYWIESTSEDLAKGIRVSWHDYSVLQRSGIVPDVQSLSISGDFYAVELKPVRIPHNLLCLIQSQLADAGYAFNVIY